MEETGNQPLFVEPGLFGEIQHVDPIELVILALLDQMRDRIRHCRVGGLPQYRKLCLDLAHD